MTDAALKDIDVQVEEPENKTADDETEVTIVATEDAPVRAPAPSTEDALQKMRVQLDAERQGRLRAEQFAAQQQERAQQASTGAQTSHLAQISIAIDSLKRTSDQIQKQIEDQLAAGQYGEVAKLQRQMAQNEAKLLDFEKGKRVVEQRLKQPVQPVAPPPQQDPVEVFASQVSPRSAAWIRAHPEYARDERLRRRMIRAHEDAIDDEYSADSDAYFEYVEKKLGLRHDRTPVNVEEDDSPMSAASAPVKRKPAPPAAPVGASTNGSSRPGVVHLSKAERDTARDLGMSEKEYAIAKQQLQKEGKLN